MKSMIAAAAVAALALAGGGAEAAQFTFASFTFEQDDTPDKIGLIGNGATIGGAPFTSGNVNAITRSVGFNSVSGTANSGFVGAPGFDPSLSLGRQANAQLGITQGDGTSCLFGCAINMPGGNNGTLNRHGFEVSWADGSGLANGAGDDFVVYESMSSSTGFEGFMVRLGDANGLFSDWRFESADSFQNYSDKPATGEGASATAFDILDFGFSGADPIVIIQIANLMNVDTLGAGGVVLFDGSGASHGFANGSLDPDPLYVGVLNGLSNTTAVPVPAALPMMAGALGVFGLLGWRRRQAHG